MKPTDALVDVRRSLHERLIGRVDARQLDAMPRAERRLRVREEALSLLREQGHMLPQNALADVVNAVSDAVVGMGPIEFLLKDPEVTEVMVNGPDDVYVERKGRIERVADRLFEGEEAVLHVIERIVAPLGLRVDATSPWVDARLPDGSRVHAIVPPLSLCGPVLNVRKFSSIPLGPGALHAGQELKLGSPWARAPGAPNARRRRRGRRPNAPSDRTWSSRGRASQARACQPLNSS